MIKLADVETGQRAVVRKIHGDTRFTSRITSIGLTDGCSIEMVQNRKKRPVLIAARDSVIAIDRGDSAHIEVEVRR